MKNYSLKFLVFVLLAVSFGFIQLSKSSADFVADQLVRSYDGKYFFISYSDQQGNFARQFDSQTAVASYRFLSSEGFVSTPKASYEIEQSESTLSVRDGVVVCATETKGSDIAGECSLISSGKKHPFASAEVFLKSGYNFERTIIGDTSNLVRSGSITLVQQTRKPGAVINDSGTVKLITSSYTTAGIPSMAVLQSWGWDLEDALPATANDRLLVETEVLQTRERGQINTPLIQDNNVAEGVVLLHFLSKYPTQPTNKAVEQSEVGALLEFHKIIYALEAYELRPYLSQFSAEIIDKIPSFLTSLGDNSAGLMDVNVRNEVATILGDGNYGRVSFDLVQQGTSYRTSGSLIYKKENGFWKLDLAETVKIELTNAVERGGASNAEGNTDLRLTSVTMMPSKDGRPNMLGLEIMNVGEREVFGYTIVAEADGKNIVSNNSSHSYYSLKPGQSIRLAMPLVHLESIGMTSGQYKIETLVYDLMMEDKNFDDNMMTVNGYLSQSFNLQ